MELESRLSKRAWHLVRSIFDDLIDLGIYEFYLGGNSLNQDNWQEINDIDLFPVSDSFELEQNDVDIVSNTKNAITFIASNGTAVQLCNYHHESLEDLVESFDFSHIQVGAHIEIEDEYLVQVKKVYFTDAWKEHRALGVTRFTGSEYPTASLVRMAKYHERGWMERGDLIYNVLEILASIIGRGFEDYEDFKDQLDAVDLGVAPEDLEEVQWETLQTIVEGLNKGFKWRGS